MANERELRAFSGWLFLCGWLLMIGRSVEIGSRIRILYPPSEPGRSWPEAYGPREQPVWVAAILPAAGVPGALLIVFLLRRQKRLLEEGRAVMARVISTE